MKTNTESTKKEGRLTIFDVVMITASGVTPASSIFVIAPLTIASAGSGSFISFLIAAFIAVNIALCYAELGAAHPSAGGEYSIIKRLFGTLCGLQTYLFILVCALFIPAVLASGAIPYLNTALGTKFDSATAGMWTVLIGGAIALLNIKTNAILTGIFLFLEVAILVLIAWLGFSNPSQSVDILISPVIANSIGLLEPVSTGLIIAMVGTALFSYNGYGAAVYMAEDMQKQGKPMAIAILLTLFIVVIVEIVPLAALIIGAPSLADMSKQADPIGYIITQLSGPTLARVVCAAIYLSVFNAIIAIVVQFSRMIFSSGRDEFWFLSVNKHLVKTHKRYNTPWVATIAYCIPSALLAFCSNLAELTSFTVILLLFVYIIMAIAALFSRNKGAHHPYLMPLWPIPAIITLVSCIYVLWTLLASSTIRDFIIIIAILILGLALNIKHRKKDKAAVIQSTKGKSS